MSLNVSNGNMYDFVTHTWNTVKGACPHDCSYCYMKRWGKQREVYLDIQGREPVQDDRKAETCKWTEEESDEYNERHYESACGLGFHLDDGRSLAENKILYCAKCGRRIKAL